MRANILRGLTSWHHQSLSAWSMVILGICSIAKYIFVAKNIPRLLILSHVLMHTPFSLMYHCSHNKYVNDYDIRYVKGDVVMIYASHIFLHIAFLWRIPWGVKSICLALMFCSCFGAIETVMKVEDVRQVTKTGLSFSWIFLLHYIPILMLKGWRFCLFHIGAFLCILCIYKYKCIANVFGCQNISIDNAFMHCGLIINNLIAFDIVY